MSNGFLTMAASRAEDSHASASTQEKRNPIAPPAGDVRLGSLADIGVLHDGCLLCAQKQTWRDPITMSAWCQKRTLRSSALRRPLRLD